MAIVTIFQRFDLVMDDPGYQLRLKQTVTIKPDGFYIRAYPRNRKARLYTTPSSAKLLQGTGKQKPTPTSVDVTGSQPLYVLYGSNSGTAESFAQRVASDAPAHGFRPSIGTLDSAAEKIPSDGPVVLITASFEGQLSIPRDRAECLPQIRRTSRQCRLLRQVVEQPARRTFVRRPIRSLRLRKS